MAAQLTEKDIDILLMAYEYGGVSLDLIRRRFWPLSKSHTPCSERVSVLVKAGYLESKRLPSLNGVGSGKAFVTISSKAKPLLAQTLSVSRRELGRSRLYSPQFISHHLAICDFRLSLEMAAETSNIFEVEEWVADREHEIRVKDPKTQRDLLLIPDGSFTLALPDGIKQTFYLEVDMGTLAPKRLRTKLRCYLVRSDNSIPVMWVTANENRLASIKRHAIDEARDVDGDPTVFWVTTRDKVKENTILASPIWQIADGPTLALSSLVPAVREVQDAATFKGQIIFTGGYLS